MLTKTQPVKLLLLPVLCVILLISCKSGISEEDSIEPSTKSEFSQITSDFQTNASLSRNMNENSVAETNDKYITMKEAWSDSIKLTYIESFSDTYLPLGYAPILSNGDFPVLLRKTDEAELNILNILTNELTPIAQAGPGYSYSYSGGDDKYIVAHKYDKKSQLLPIPIEFVIYDREARVTLSVDLTSLQKANGMRYVYPYVSIYDGAMYFELSDREIIQNDLGETIDYGISIYKYVLSTEKIEKVQSYGSAPSVTSEGMYFMDKSSDEQGGSLYFKKNSSEETIELIPNCNEYQIFENKIMFTRDSQSSFDVANQQIFIFENGVETKLFQQNSLESGWDFRYNGRLICWSHTSAPLYVYDCKLQQKVELSDITGANLCIPSDKYIYWYESTDENAEKGQEIHRLCIVDISKLN